MSTTPSFLQQVLDDVLSTFPNVTALAVVDGSELISAGATPVAGRAAGAVQALFREADQVAAELGEQTVEQIVVDTPDGAVAGLRDGSRLAVAITAAHTPSLGLLLYDLRRGLSAAVAEAPGPARSRRA